MNMTIGECRLARSGIELYYQGIQVVFVGNIDLPKDLSFRSDLRIIQLMDRSLRSYLAYHSPEGVKTIGVIE